MGFFASGEKQARAKRLPTELLHKLECKACPLNASKCKSPKMPAAGAKAPVVYILGDMPSTEDDRKGVQFSGAVGDFLERRMPKGWYDDLRWNNIIRTYPGPRDPEPVEIECCRPSVTRDIANSAPTAIFGFGHVPLKWMTGLSSVVAWRGRRIPVRIGDHPCWYYPFFHPEYLMRTEGDPGGKTREHMFKLDLRKAFQEVEDGLPEPIVHSTEDVEREVEYVTSLKKDDVERVVEFLEKASRAKYAGLDFETNGLRPYRPENVILSVAVSIEGRTLAWPMHHPEARWAKGGIAKINEAFTTFIKSKCQKIVHQLAFEMEWIAVKYGSALIRGDSWEDTISQAFILDERVGESKPGCLALDFLVAQYFGVRIKALSQLDRKKLIDEPMHDVLRYNGIDAKYHRLLFHAQDARLQAEDLSKQYLMMLDRVPAVVLTQIKGVPVDQKVVERLLKDILTQLNESDKQLAKDPDALTYQKRRGQVFDPNSNKEILYLMQRVLDQRVDSADEEALKAVNAPICNLILKRREIIKLKSTYIEPLQAKSPLIYPDGLLHPILNTVVAETGRLSSEDPNEQNFPKHKNRHVREQVKALINHILASFDYGQIEARVIAMASRDKTFVKALWERYDVHKEWAARIAAECPTWKKVHGGDLKVMRQEAKNLLVFPAFFGAMDQSVARYLDIPEISATRLLRDFWKYFHGVKDWQEKVVDDYQRDGYVVYLTGRRRHGPLSRNQLFNSPIQGVAADIVLDAMTALSRLDDWWLQPIMNIHDDLTFHLHEDELEKRAVQIIDQMLKVEYDFVNVPITIEYGVGEHWANIAPVGDYSSDTWKGSL